MSYQYATFGGVALPLYNHTQKHDPMPAETSIYDSVGGAWDWLGSSRRSGRKQVLSCQGIYMAETSFLVDELGNFIVDELNRRIAISVGTAGLRSQVDALLELRGERASLIRRRLDDSVLQWKTARLLEVQWQRKYEDHALLAELSCQFESLMENWRANTATNSSGNAVAGVQLPLNIESLGEIQTDDAVMTITRTSGTITSVTVTCVANGIQWTWAGSLGASDVLTVDCSMQTIRKNSTDAYSGFTKGGSHTANGWLPLREGVNSLLISVIGGNATVAVSHYDQYP